MGLGERDRTGEERRGERKKERDRDVGRIWDSGGVVTLAASCAAAVCVQLNSFTRLRH